MDAREQAEFQAQAERIQRSVIETVKCYAEVLAHLDRVAQGNTPNIHDARKAMRRADALAHGLQITVDAMARRHADDNAIEMIIGESLDDHLRHLLQQRS